MRTSPSLTPPSTGSSRARRALTAAALGTLAAGLVAVPASASDTVVLGAAKSKAPNRTQIVGGTPITTEQAPHQVYIEITAPGGGGSSCGGSIIDSTHVLTAAHCTFDGLTNLPIDTPASYLVVAGVADLNTAPGGGPGESPQVRTASGISRHPGYVSPPGGGGTLEQLADDAAVITLPTPLDLSTSRVRSVPLVAPGPNPPTATSVFASGYGRQQDGGTADGKLYGLNTALADATSPDAAGPLNALYVMTQSAQGSTCQGDSGGGLIANGAVVGIVSSGARCGQNEIGNFTSVAANEIQTYIRNAVSGTNDPIPPAPRGGQDVTLTVPASLEVGKTVTCAAGTWTNGPTYTYRFRDGATGGTLQESASATYALQPTDFNRTISCSASATTPGGVGYTPVTRASTPVKADPTPAPTPTPTPTPTPKPTPKPDPARFSPSLVSGSSSVRKGSRVSFRVTVRNTGDVAAKNVRVCVRPSSRFSIVSRGGAKLVGGRLCWTMAQLGGSAQTRQRVSSSVTHRFSLRADRDAPAGRRTAATVSVTATGVRSASARRVVTIRPRATAAAPGGVTG